MTGWRGEPTWYGYQVGLWALIGFCMGMLCTAVMIEAFA